MKTFCENLKAHATKLNSYEKKKMLPLAKKEKKSYERQKFCHICKEELGEEFNEDKGYYKVQE